MQLDDNGDEITSTVNIYELGDSYYDEKLKAYSIADEYVITEDDLPAFGIAFRGLRGVLDTPSSATLPTGTNLNKLEYLCLRYLLLLIDIGWNDLDNLMQEDYGEEEEDTEDIISTVEKPPFKGTPAYTRIYRMLRTFQIGENALGTPQSDFIKSILGLYFNPPTADETFNVNVVASIPSSLQALRSSVLAKLASVDAATLAERTAARAQQTRLNTLSDTATQDTQLTDTIVARLVTPLALTTTTAAAAAAQGQTSDAESLGNVIRGALSSLILANVNDPDTPPTTITRQQIVNLPGLTPSIQSAVEIWIREHRPQSIWSQIPDIKQSIAMYITGLRAPSSLTGGGSLQSADDISSNAGGSSSSIPSGGRRGLYARLRKRSGSGSPPGLRE
jgi:hypothetical protein